MIEIKPMDESYIHIDCLHGGPLDPASPPNPVQHPPDAPALPPHPWSDETIAELATKYERISHGSAEDGAMEFMREMIQRYGTCAILAWEGGKVVGQLRFYPLTIAQLLARADPQRQGFMIREGDAVIFDADPGTLWVHCVMTSVPFVGRDEVVSGKHRFPSMEKAGARRGTGLKLVQGLISWAREHRWKRIVKQAHADLDYMYGIYGGGGKALWEKAGFRVIGTHPHDAQDEGGKAIVEKQRREKGMSQEEAQTWFHMAYDL